MQNKFKKGISIVLAVLMLMASVPLAGFTGLELPAITVDAGAAISDGDIPEGIIASGICGDNLTWTLDSDGVLTISGTGDMYDYDGRNPWEDNYNELIKTIVLEDGVTSIGECAFWVCDSLTSITIPDSVTSIGPWAFTSCASLTSIAIPDSVTSIGDMAFSSCTSLISITLPENLTSIGDGAFNGCTSLISITLPENLTNIDDFTFMSCKSLTSITIPDSVTNIGAYAFDECNLLANIEVLNPECVIYDDAYTISDTATIYGYENSTAQEYAGKYDRTFVSLGTAPGGNITDGDIPGGNITGGDLPAEYGNASVVLESDWNIDENGRFYVDLYVDNSVGMTSWTFDLVFDSDILTFVDYEDGTAVAECDETKNNRILNMCGNAENGKLRYGGVISHVMWTPEDFSADAKTNKDANVNPYHCHLVRLSFSVNDPEAFREQQVEITASGSVDYAGSYDNNPKYPAVDSKQTRAAIFGNFVPDIVTSGICGDNLTWTLDSTGLLTISGNGAMYDFTDPLDYPHIGAAPWLAVDNFSIEQIVISNGVTSIGDCAFNYCALTDITIPDSVTSIGDSAFSDCYSLTDITIPDSVTSIGDSAFYYCYSLTDITIPDSVKNIGDWAFDYCTSLTSIFIPDSVTNIGDGAFCNCDSLNSITIPDSVTSIGDHVFSGCTSLTGIIIPDSVTSIGDYAFSCSSLTNITIPDSVTNIGNNAFSYSSLTDITIPDSVTSIGEYAFAVCSSLTDITILNPACVISDSGTAISETATIHGYKNSTAQEYAGKYDRTFVSLGAAPGGNITGGDLPADPSQNEDGIVFSISDNQATVIGYNGSASELVIPPQFNGYPVTSIGSCAFNGCDSLTTIAIPDSVTYIDSSALSGCFSLAKITVDANNAFFSNDEYGVLFSKDKTTLIQYPEGNARTSYTIPDGVTSVGVRAFFSCHSLTSIIIPDSVTVIDWEAFVWCTSLTNITIPDSVTSIGNIAFHGCSSLTSITIPDSVKSIGDFAFHSCYSLTSITILNPDCDIYGGSNTIYNTAVIYGYSNSTAQEYAQQHNRTFVALDEDAPTDPEHKHSYTAVVTAPTCTAQGFSTYTCICGDSYVADYIEALGHTEETIPAVAATCTETGLTAGVKCSVCGEILTEQETVPVAAHNLPDVWTVTQNPAIGKAGEECRQCANCDYTETRTIPALTLTVTDREDSGVEFDFADGTFNTDSGDITVIIEKDEEQSAFLLTDYTKVCAWNITFFAEDGSEIQPDATVTVKMPIPDGYNTNSLQLLHIDPTTNESTPVSFTVENGFVIFDAESFSVYVLIDTSAVTENEPSAEPNDPSEDCSHLCHKDGILGFFWKILRFFWKLFKMHPVCECGAAHY